MFICTGCQKEYEVKTKFCSECGGKIEAKIEVAPTVYACSQCGKEYDEPNKFCSECGGKIEAKVEVAPAVYTCSQCGKEHDETSKFCSECGGKVAIQQVAVKSAAHPVTAVHTPQAINPVVCSNFKKQDFFNAFFRSYKFAPSINLEYADENSVVFSTHGCRGVNLGSVIKTTVTLDMFVDNCGKMQTKIAKKTNTPTLLGWLLLLSGLVTFGLTLIPFALLWMRSLSDKKFAIESQVLWFNLLAPHVDCFTLPDVARYNLNGKNPVEIAEIAFKTFGRNTNPLRCCCFAGALNMEKVQTAISSYANEVDINSIICHICPAQDSGQTGTLITTTGIYSRFKIGLFPIVDHISYNEVNMAGNWNSLICNNFSKTFYWTNFTENYNQVKNQLDNSQNYIVEQKELMEFIRAMQCKNY